MSLAVFSHIQLMNPKLEAKYLRLEKSRNRLLNELAGLSDVELNTPAADGKWSINQIVSHLIMVEQYAISYIHRKIEQDELLTASELSNTVNNVLLKLAMLSPFKFKAPSVVATVPAHANFSLLRRQWDETRFKLEDLLTEVPHTLFYKYLFKHPLAGALTVNQTLSFLQDHFNHHLYQIKAIKYRLLS